MSRLRALVLTVLVAGSLFGGSVLVGATDGSSEHPRVDITVDSTPVADGEEYETGRDVDITVEASVSDGAPNGTELDEIVVRVNGDRYETFDVTGANATETVRPSLDGGDNSVRVIVTDEAENVKSTQFTVVKDGEAPHVFLNDPYQTGPWKRIPDGTANGSETVLAGEIIEDSRVAKLQVTHEYGEIHTETHVMRDVGDNFSVPLTLGKTFNDTRRNRIRITATDEFDNVRIYQFDVNVTDTGGPTISVGPFPNETSQNRIFFSGTIRDDVWIDQANVTFEAVDINAPNGSENKTDFESLLEPRRYRLDVDRRTLSFNESFYPAYAGTYRVTVNATDITGNTTTRTFEITRKPYEPADLRPEIVVNRDRTVVLDAETLFLSGVTFEGITRRLVVETRDDDTGETVDYQVVHRGSNRDRVDFDRELRIGDGRTTVIVRATDPEGNEVTERFTVDGESRETFVGDEATPDDWPAVTVVPLEDGRPATASSSVSVRRASSGDTVAIPAAGGASSVAGTENVTLDGLDLSITADTNLTATVVVRERGDGELSVPRGGQSAGTVTIQHSLAAENVSEVTLTLSVNRTYLDAHGLEPTDLRLYRQSGDGWTELRTDLVNSDESTVQYEVVSPGLSVFSLSTVTDVGTDERSSGFFDGVGDVSVVSGPGGDWTVVDETDGDGTSGGGTDGDESASTNGTDGGSNDSTASAGSARIFVSNVTVNRTQVAVNESVTVNATLTNVGNASGTYVAGFQTFQGLNGTFVEKQSATVPPDEDRNLTFRTSFQETGNHTVSVNGTQAGPVVVAKGGGLLSMFAFLPLGLIGMALGGFVGLAIVLMLVRFVLRRVGDGGEEASG